MPNNTNNQFAQNKRYKMSDNMEVESQSSNGQVEEQPQNSDNETMSEDSPENAQEEEAVVEETEEERAAREKAEEEARIAEQKEKALKYKALGNDKFKAKDYYPAIDLYTMAIEADPECAVFYLNRAAARMMVNQLDNAAKDCRQAIHLDPKNLKAHVRLGKALLQRGLFNDSIAAFQKALLLDPTNSQALEEKKQGKLQIERVTRAKQCVESKDYRRAMSYITAGLRISPDSRELNLLKAEGLIGEGEHDQAYALTTKLMRDNQNDNVLLFVRAKILYHQENFANAIKHLQQALRSDPDNAKFSIEIKKLRKLERLKEQGNQAFKKHDMNTAIDCYSQCLEIDPDNKTFCSKLYCNRAAAKSKQGKNSEALLDCDKAIELNKDYGKAYIRRALCLRSLGGKENIERALFDYGEAERLMGRTRDLQMKMRETKLELKKAKRKDYYKLLQLPNRENSSEAEIKKAYKKAALRCHPDRHTNSTPEEKEAAEAKFKDVGEAYNVLSDPQKKQQYDRGMDLEEIEQGGGFHGGGFGGAAPEDIFNMFFGGGGGVHFG